MPVGRRSSVWTSHSWSSRRRMVSPAPPSKSTLSGTTTAARPLIFSSDRHVLDEVELLVARRRPEVRAVVGDRLRLSLALLVDDGDARLLAERRVGEDDLVTLTARCAASRPPCMGGVFSSSSGPMPWRKRFMAQRRVTPSTISTPRRASKRRCLFWSLSRSCSRRRCSRARRGGSRRCRRRGRGSRSPGFGRMHSTMAWMSGARREVLPGAALHVLRVPLQQALVGVALHVGASSESTLPADQVDDEPPQLGRVLDLVLRLAEDDAPASRLVLPSSSSVLR